MTTSAKTAGPNVAGMAALAICKALLLALNDRNILPDKEIQGVLRAAATSTAKDTGDIGIADLQQAVATLINGMAVGGNSVRDS